MSEFRDYIVSMLSRTSYARNYYTDSQLDQLSDMLGVRLDTLLEARLTYRERATALGSASGRLEEYRARKKDSKSDYAALTLHLHPEAKKIVEHHAVGRGLNIPALFRSIVHHYLLGSWEPTQLYDAWFLPGLTEEYQRGRREKGQRTVINAAMTPAVREAFSMRAEMLSTTIETLGRTLLIETVLGNFGKVGTLSVVTRRQLYTDVSRYQTRFEEDPVQLLPHQDFGGDDQEGPR